MNLQTLSTLTTWLLLHGSVKILPEQSEHICELGGISPSSSHSPAERALRSGTVYVHSMVLKIEILGRRYRRSRLRDVGQGAVSEVDQIGVLGLELRRRLPVRCDPLCEPLDHFDRDLLAAPSVLQDQLARVLPVSLEPDLFIWLLCLDRGHEQCHPARMPSDLLYELQVPLEVGRRDMSPLQIVRGCGREHVPEPQHASLVGCRSIAEAFGRLELLHEVVPIVHLEGGCTPSVLHPLFA